MERDGDAMISLFSESVGTAGSEVPLDDDAAQHARVRRVEVGEAVRLVDGRGAEGIGTFAAVAKREVRVRITDVRSVTRPATLEVIVPVADKDRLLLAAEKCVELGITAWRPAWFSRSRSVSSRGEGERFRERVRARMVAALEQSGGAWLPDLYEEVEGADAWTQVAPTSRRLLLRHDGSSIAGQVTSGPMAVAVGPEGGWERDEIVAAEHRGWVSASLGTGTLRFETAVITGVAVIRAMQLK